jgi:hypothetical protein
MKISRLVIVFGLILINFYPLISIGAVDNPMSFGIPANDGTSIQCFVSVEASVSGKQISIPLKIPQDTDTLEYDFFWVFLDIRDLEERTFSVYYYELADNGSINKMLGNKTFTVKGGQNEWHDSRFALLKIDQSNYIEFEQTDTQKMFWVEYKDVSFTFFHLTNPALVIVPISRGELTSQVLMYVIMCFFMLVMAAFASSKIKSRVNTWMDFDLATVLLLITWMFGGFLVYATAAGISTSEITRQAVQIPIIVVEFILAILLGLWIPSFFLEDIVELHVVKYDPMVDTKEVMKNFLYGKHAVDPKNQILVGYEKLHVFKTPEGMRFYKNARSLIEILGNLIHGHTAIRNLEQCYRVSITESATTLKKSQGLNQRFHRVYKDQEEKRKKIDPHIIQDLNYHGQITAKESSNLGFHLKRSDQKAELLFVRDFEWKKSLYDGAGVINNLLKESKIVSGAIIGSMLVIIILAMFLRVNVQFIGIIGFIFVFMLILYWLYDYTKQYKFLDITPVSRSALEVIFDAKKIDKMESLTVQIANDFHTLKSKYNIDLAKEKAYVQIEYLKEWDKLMQGESELGDPPYTPTGKEKKKSESKDKR